MLKDNNKFKLWTCFTTFFSVSLVEFEQANVSQDTDLFNSKETKVEISF